MRLGYIADGYTERGIIEEFPGIHPAVKIEWRPMLLSELAVYSQAVEEFRGYQLREVTAHILKGKLVSWNLKDKDGRVVPIEVPDLLRTKARLFNRLIGVVSGEQAAQEDPEDRRDQSAESKALHEAVAAGRSPLAVLEESDRKNS